MFSKERLDGTYIRNVNFFTQITPFVKPARTDSVIVFEREYDVTKTMEFARQKDIPFTHILLFAALRTIAVYPKINRFISGLRYYQRNRIAFNFNVTDYIQIADSTVIEEKDINVIMSFSPLLTFENFLEKLQDYKSFSLTEKKENTRTEKVLSVIQKLPRFLIKFLIWGVKFLNYHNALPVSFTNSLPYFCSIIFTNANMDAAYYHNFDIGTCGIFCTIGKINNINGREKIKMTFTYDDRITAPAYFAEALDMLCELTENPEKLEEPLELITEQLVKLGLSEKELNNI